MESPILRRWIERGIENWKWVAAAIVTLGMGVLALDLYPGLRGGGGWQWAYELPARWLPVVILALLLLLYLTLAFWLRSKPARFTLLLAYLGSVVITLAVVGVRGDIGFLLFTRTVSPVQTGASALAVRTLAQEGVLPSLQHWTQIMDDALSANLIHFTTSPPGQPLLHYGIAQFFDSPVLTLITEPVSMALRPYQCSDPQVMRYTRGEIISAGFGMLLPLLAALAVFPLYTAAADLTGDSKAAQRMVIWWALVPTIALFAPTWNTLYPALCVLAFALLLRGLMRSFMRQHGAGYTLAAGMVMAFTTLLNFAVLPVFLLFGLFTLGYYFWIARKSSSAAITPGWFWTIRQGFWFGIGLVSLWLLFALVTGLNPLDVLRTTFASHKELVHRSYLTWLVLHPYDVALFVGFPLMILALWGALQARRRIPKLPVLPVDILALAMLVTLGLVDLAGIVQGENGRILSFYAPFLLLSGGRFWTESETINHNGGHTPKSRLAPDAPLLVTQGISLLVMASVLAVVPLDLNPQPLAPRQDMGSLGDSLAFIPAEAAFSSTDYVGQFRLAQYRYIGDPSAQAISYEFIWDANTPTERPYQFELIAHAYNDQDGEIEVEPFRWYPQNGNYLTTCWHSPESIRDVVVLRLPVISAPVVWEVTLRAVDERTGDVMRITPLPNGQTGDSLALEPVKYP